MRPPAARRRTRERGPEGARTSSAQASIETPPASSESPAISTGPPSSAGSRASRECRTSSLTEGAPMMGNYYTFPSASPCRAAPLHGVHEATTRALAALGLAALASLPARAQEDEHKLIHVGAMVGPALPRPLDGEVFVKLMDLVQVGFSYSDFPNFIASPFLSAIDANN